MLLFNEQHQQLDAEAVQAELANLADVPTPTEDEVKATLQTYYQQALQLEGNHFGFNAEFAAPAQLALFPGIGGILDKIRKFVCSIINADSTESEIINAILQAIASLMGGLVIKLLLQPIIKFILSQGFGHFCPAPAVAAAPANA